MSKGNGSMNFKDLRQLQSMANSGLIKVVTPDKEIDAAIGSSVAELANLWTSRNNYAIALIRAGVPDADVMQRAEALAVSDHRQRTEQVLALFRIHGGKVPNGLKYVAHLVGLDADALTKPEEVPVNLHG
jgi:hypothetical protein